jgi:RAB protein geranylgeranyltransferase component A
MLDKQIEKIVTDANGKFVGVTSGGETVKAKQVIGDPSYFGAGGAGDGGKVRVVEDGKVVRAICILKHPIPSTDDSDSCQIIIPQNQVNRRNGELESIGELLVSSFSQIFTLLWFRRPTTSVPKTSTSPLSAPLSRPTTRISRSSLG